MRGMAVELQRPSALLRPSATPKRLAVSVRCSNTRSSAQAPSAATATTRRAALLAAVAAPLLLAPQLAVAAEEEEEEEEVAPPSSSVEASASAVEVLQDQEGSGTAGARPGDLLLLHYVGTNAADGSIFDSTRGGLRYRDGGEGAMRPVIVSLSPDPVPGICEGLKQGVLGMRVGGRRTIRVPASLGFGPGQVLAPYSVLPGGSTLQYELELVRLSRVGPDALMKNVSQCGGGFIMARSSGCAEIQPAEFL